MVQHYKMCKCALLSSKSIKGKRKWQNSWKIITLLIGSNILFMRFHYLFIMRIPLCWQFNHVVCKYRKLEQKKNQQQNYLFFIAECLPIWQNLNPLNRALFLNWLVYELCMFAFIFFFYRFFFSPISIFSQSIHLIDMFLLIFSYISNAPKLMHLSANVFEGITSSLKSLWDSL